MKKLLGIFIALLAALALGIGWMAVVKKGESPATRAASAESSTSLSSEASPTPNAAALEQLGQGLEAQLQRRPEEALDKFGKALEADAKLPGVRYQMAVAAYQAGDEEAAKKHAGEAIAAGKIRRTRRFCLA